MIAALERNKKALRQEVARRVNLKFAPDLRFLRDETFDEADRIDALLRTDKVRRDLESRAPDEAEDSPADETPDAPKPAGARDPDAA